MLLKALYLGHFIPSTPRRVPLSLKELLTEWLKEGTKEKANEQCSMTNHCHSYCNNIPPRTKFFKMECSPVWLSRAITTWNVDSNLYPEIDMCLVTQSCQSLGDSMDCSLTGSSVRRDSPGKNNGMGCHVLLQEIFPTQGSNPGLGFK